ncbi:DM13 domain-containing protein [Actinocorallia lasiicapitis]
MSRKGWAAVVAALGAVALVIGLAAFQPWKLWVDDRAADADLAVPTAPAAPGETAQTPASQGPVKVFEGERWHSYSHGETTGRVVLYRQPDGGHVLRLQDLSTSNGPDVKVVLSPKPVGDLAALGGDYLTLATLKGNKGSSNYPIAADVDLSRYRSAVIWCKRFDAVFAAVALG